MEVTLYSNHCPQCKYLKSLLGLKKDITVINEVNDEDLMKSMGMMSMPQLEVNGKIMIYADVLQWIKTIN